MPKSVAVTLEGKRVTVSLSRGKLPAEQALARSPAGADLLQLFHQAMLASSCGPLPQEVGGIIGVEVRETVVKVQAGTGTLVLVFLLAASVSEEMWNTSAPAD